MSNYFEAVLIDNNPYFFYKAGEGKHGYLNSQQDFLTTVVLLNW